MRRFRPFVGHPWRLPAIARTFAILRDQQDLRHIGMLIEETKKLFEGCLGTGCVVILLPEKKSQPEACG
ncbi:hypothetical protein LA22_16385, partial [Xanthomonas oryzae pv. oryzae]